MNLFVPVRKGTTLRDFILQFCAPFYESVSPVYHWLEGFLTPVLNRSDTLDPFLVWGVPDSLFDWNDHLTPVLDWSDPLTPILEWRMECSLDSCLVLEWTLDTHPGWEWSLTPVLNWSVPLTTVLYWSEPLTHVLCRSGPLTPVLVRSDPLLSWIEGDPWLRSRCGE